MVVYLYKYFTPVSTIPLACNPTLIILGAGHVLSIDRGCLLPETVRNLALHGSYRVAGTSNVGVWAVIPSSRCSKAILKLNCDEKSKQIDLKLKVDKQVYTLK